MTVLWEKLDALLQHRGVKIAALARETKVPDHTIRNIKRGQSTTPGYDVIRPIAAYFGIDPDLLADDSVSVSALLDSLLGRRDDAIRTGFALRLVSVRVQQGLTAPQFADAAGIPIDRVRDLEDALSEPTLSELSAIAGTGMVSLDYLIAGKTEDGAEDEIAEPRPRADL